MADNKLIIELGSKLAGDFGTAFQSAKTRVSSLSKELAELKKQQNLVKRFDIQTASLDKAKLKLNAANAAVKQLAVEITKNPGKKLSADFTKAHEAAEKLRVALNKKRVTLGQTRAAMTAAGVDTKNTTVEFQRLERQIKETGTQLQKNNTHLKSQNQNANLLGTSFRGLGTAVATLGVGFGVLSASRFLGDSIEESELLQRNLKRTEQLIISTGAAAGHSAEQLHGQARGLALATLESTEGVMQAQQVMLTFRSVTGDTFTRAIGLAADLATVTGVDLKSSVTQLGKALEDPVKGINAMTRSGVSFTQGQKDVIKSLVETGDKAAAQKVILDELSRQYGGVAKAEATGYAGAIDTLGQSWQEAKQSLGAFVTEGDTATGMINRTSDALFAVPGLINSISASLPAVTQAVTAVGGGLVLTKVAMYAYQRSATLATAATLSYSAASRVAAASSTQFTGRLTALNAVMPAATLAGRGLAMTMAMLGGPVGLLILAATAAYTYRKEIYESISVTGQLEKATRAHDQILQTAKSNAYAYATATAEVRNQLRGENQDALSAAKGELTLIKTRLEAAKLRIKTNKEELQNRSLGPRGEMNRMSQITTDTQSISNLNKQMVEYERLARGVQLATENMGKGQVELKRVFAESEPPTKAAAGATEALKKQINDLVPPVQALFPVLQETGKSASGAAGGADKLNKSMEEGKRLTESLHSPQEKYNDTIKDYDNLLAKGAISQSTYNQAVTKAQKSLNDATGVTAKATQSQGAHNKVMEKGKRLTESLLSPQEKYNDTIKDYDNLLAKSAISQSTYNQAVTKAQKSLDDATGATAKATKAQEARNKVTEEGKRLTESLQTPQEKYNNTIKNYDNLLKKGAITQGTYNQAVTKAQKSLDDATGATAKATKAQEARNKVMEEGKRLTESLQTPQEKYNNTIKDYDSLLKKGAISQGTYNQAVTKAQKSLDDATGATAKAAKAQEARNKVMEEGKRLTESLQTPQEKYNATIESYKNLLDKGAISQGTFNQAVAKAKEGLEGTNQELQNLRNTADGLGEIMVKGMLSGDWQSAGQKVLGLLDKNFIAPMQQKLSGAISQALQGKGSSGFSDILGSLQSNSLSGAMAGGGLGMMAGQMFGQTGIGSGIGGAIGTAVAGPIGMAVGSLLGGLVESLFGGKQSIKAKVGQYAEHGDESRWYHTRRDQGKALNRSTAFGDVGLIKGSRSVGRDDEAQVTAIHQTLDAMQATSAIMARLMPPSAVDAVKQRMAGFTSNAVEPLKLLKQHTMAIVRSSAVGIQQALQGIDGGLGEKSIAEIAARIEYVGAVSQQVSPMVDQMGLNISKRWDLALRDTVRLTDAMGGVQQTTAGLQSVYTNLMSPTQQFSASFTTARQTIIDVNTAAGNTNGTLITTRAGLLDYIQGLDLSNAKNAELAAQAVSAAGAMGAFATAIQGIQDMFASTISNIENDLLTQAEKQKKYMTEAESLFNQLKAESDPGKIAEMSEKINAAVSNAWSNMTADQKSANADYLKTMLQSSSDLASEQMKGAMSNADLMKSAISAMDKPVSGLQTAAAGMQSAASAMATAAAAMPTSIEVTTSNAAVDGSYAAGLNRVPKDNWLSNLHKDELVATASQANLIRSGLPVVMDSAKNIVPAGLNAANDNRPSPLPANVTPLRRRADKLLNTPKQANTQVSQQGDNITITINQAPGQDPAAVARQVQKVLQQHEQQKARQQRTRGYD